VKVVLFCPVLASFETLKVPRVCRLVLLIRFRRIWKSVGQWWIDTDRVKRVPVLRFPTIDLTWNGPGSNPDVRDESPPETLHGVLKTKINIRYKSRIQFLPHRERSALIIVRIVPNTGMQCGQNAVMLVLNLAVHIRGLEL